MKKQILSILLVAIVAYSFVAVHTVAEGSGDASLALEEASLYPPNMEPNELSNGEIPEGLVDESEIEDLDAAADAAGDDSAKRHCKNPCHQGRCGYFRVCGKIYQCHHCRKGYYCDRNSRYCRQCRSPCNGFYCGWRRNQCGWYRCGCYPGYTCDNNAGICRAAGSCGGPNPCIGKCGYQYDSCGNRVKCPDCASGYHCDYRHGRCELNRGNCENICYGKCGQQIWDPCHGAMLSCPDCHNYPMGKGGNNATTAATK